MAAPLENNDSIEPNTETIESDLDAVPAAEETTSGTAKTQTEDELELNSTDGETAFEVPALIDRPLDIEEGPYIYVDDINIIDTKDYPEYDVSLTEIKETILSQLLEEQPERGFSIGELQEVADEVTRYYRSKGLILSTAVVPVQTVTDGIVNIQVFIGLLGRVVSECNK